MSKKLPTDTITSELSRSVFFQKSAAGQVYNHPPNRQQKTESRSSLPSTQEDQITEEKQQIVNPVNNEKSNPDVMIDVMTSHLPEVNFKKWQEIIEDTETQNSALRLTSNERYDIEDVINELRRQYGIKTSMNEIARLGLLVLLSDFKERKKDSLIHRVKKA